MILRPIQAIRRYTILQNGCRFTGCLSVHHGDARPLPYPSKTYLLKTSIRLASDRATSRELTQVTGIQGTIGDLQESSSSDQLAKPYLRFIKSKQGTIHNVEIEGFAFDEANLCVNIDGEEYSFANKRELRNYKRRLIRGYLAAQREQEFEREVWAYEQSTIDGEELQQQPSMPKRSFATLAEAIPIVNQTLPPRPKGRFKQATGQPYSLPDPLRYWMKDKYAQRNLFANMDTTELPTATAHSEQATKSLLLTFDAFGTLFAPREPVERQYAEVFKAYGYPDFDLNEIKQSFRKTFKKTLSEWPNYGKWQEGVDVEKWWTNVIEGTLRQLIESNKADVSPSLQAQIPPELAENLYDRFKSDKGYALFPDVSELFERLRTAYQAALWPPSRTMLGIISNSDPRVRSILKSFGIEFAPLMCPVPWAPRKHRDNWTREVVPQSPQRPSFSFSTLSYECESSKPAPGIYHAAIRDAQAALDSLAMSHRLTRSGLNPLKNINRDFHHMHVGDDIDNDIVPALKLGWDAVLIDRSVIEPLTHREIAGYKVPVINSLVQLENLVRKERIEDKDGPGSRWINVETRRIDRPGSPSRTLRDPSRDIEGASGS